MGSRAPQVGIECGGQFHIEACKAQVFHVALGHCLDRERLIGPTLDKSRRHATQKAHDVLLAESTICHHTDLTGMAVVESIEVHGYICPQVGLWRTDPQAWQGDAQRVHIHLGRDLVNSQSALFLERALAQRHAQAWRTIVERINAHVDIAQGDMVDIESFGLYLETVVISQGAFCPIEFPHLIQALAKVEIAIGHAGISQGGSYLQSVARHVQGDGCRFHPQPIYGDSPLVFALRGIWRNGIAQLHTHLCILQQGIIHLYRFLGPVDAMTGKVESLHHGFDTRLMHKVGGIEMEPRKVEGVDLYLLTEQRHQLDTHHQTLHIGNGILHLRQRVVGLYHAEMVNAQIQGKHQRHMTYADVHAGFFRGIRCHLLHCPVLHGWQIKQHSKCNEQHQRCHHYCQEPFPDLFHLHR